MLALACLHDKTDVIRLLSSDSRIDLQSTDEVKILYFLSLSLSPLLYLHLTSTKQSDAPRFILLAVLVMQHPSVYYCELEPL